MTRYGLTPQSRDPWAVTGQPTYLQIVISRHKAGFTSKRRVRRHAASRIKSSSRVSTWTGLPSLRGVRMQDLCQDDQGDAREVVIPGLCRGFDLNDRFTGCVAFRGRFAAIYYAKHWSQLVASVPWHSRWYERKVFAHKSGKMTGPARRCTTGTVVRLGSPSDKRGSIRSAPNAIDAPNQADKRCRIEARGFASEPDRAQYCP